MRDFVSLVRTAEQDFVSQHRRSTVTDQEPIYTKRISIHHCRKLIWKSERGLTKMDYSPFKRGPNMGPHTLLERAYPL